MLSATMMPVLATEGNQKHQGPNPENGNEGTANSQQGSQGPGSQNHSGNQYQGNHSGPQGQQQHQNQTSHDGQQKRYQYRRMNCTGNNTQARIRSYWQCNNSIESIEIDFTTDPEPTLTVYYMPSGTISDIQLTFKIALKNILEFTDKNHNNRYDLSDEIHSTYLFKSIQFANITYDNITTANGEDLLQMNIQTLDGVFTLDLFMADTLSMYNNQTLTPSEMKLDFTIQNYPYINNTSKLTLVLELMTEHNRSLIPESYDEQQGYAQNETALSINSKHYSGFLSWLNQVVVDGISKPLTATVLDEEHTHNGTVEKIQYLSFTYPHGTEIIHDPKIGVISQSIYPDLFASTPLSEIISNITIALSYIISICIAAVLFFGIIFLRRRQI